MFNVSTDIFITINLAGVPFVLVVIYFYMSELKEKQKTIKQKEKILEKRISELEEQVKKKE